MSVSTMARLAKGNAAEPDAPLRSAQWFLAAHLPSEALAVSIAVLGPLNPSPAGRGRTSALFLPQFARRLGVRR
jgi:hypothetical protein